MIHNDLLKRYWFDIDGYAGVGITAFSLEDAKNIFQEFLNAWQTEKGVREIIEDVDVQELRTHVKTNMGPPSFRGVWYPCFNLYGPYERQ